MNITLTQGATVHVATLRQHKVYAGLLEGLPSERLNNALIQSLRQDAQKLIGDDGKVASIAPATSMEMTGRPGSLVAYPCLPAYATVVVLERGMSHLAVACFSQEIGLDDACVAAIKDLDWKALSTEINW